MNLQQTSCELTTLCRNGESHENDDNCDNDENDKNTDYNNTLYTRMSKLATSSENSHLNFYVFTTPSGLFHSQNTFSSGFLKLNAFYASLRMSYV